MVVKMVMQTDWMKETSWVHLSENRWAHLTEKSSELQMVLMLVF